ncbi:MAG TPA: UPF0182 family protein [Thermoanaerobaculia bacterium]|nr:UPF0182 family protein [Thermoanaerobaculia bacterium]
MPASAIPCRLPRTEELVIGNVSRIDDAHRPRRLAASEGPQLPGWSRGLRLGFLGLAILLVLLGLSWSASFYADWLWFGALGYREVLVTLVTAQAWLFLAGAGAFAALAGVNVRIALRAADSSDSRVLPEEIYRRARRLLRWGAAAVVALGALLFGRALAGEWDLVLRYLHAVPFDQTEPVFGRDVGFYVFTLPALHLSRGWLLTAVLLTLVLVAGIHYLSTQMQGRTFRFSGPLEAQVAALGAAVFLLVAWGRWLARYDLLYSASGAVYGVGYTEAHATLPAYTALAVAAVAAAVILVVSAFASGSRLMVWTVAAWVALYVLGTAVYPSVVQRFHVEPSELARERPFLAQHIELTRRAYGLDRIRSRSHPARGEIDARTIAENPGTVANVRLWDEGPLLDSYNQIQFFRLYYDFLEVTTDRYRIGDELRQVMLSTRELAPEKLPQEAQRWVNRHLQFTHGYGAAMTPVTEVAADGRPAFVLKDVPPVGEIPLERPEIYYGLKSLDFVITNSRMQEFNYPGPDGPVYTHYAGSGGVTLDSTFRKLLFAWHFRDLNILITGEIEAGSRIQYRRGVRERFSTVTPYLVRDRAPYSVVADGRLFWIQDAYTTTDRYPYSQPWGTGINYIRNSVKAVVDAYDGSVDYYVSDPDDPLIRTYQAIFPGVFRPMEELPEYLRAHVRYPLDLFTIQVQMLLQYQMEDPVVFYNKEDQWSLPIESSFGGTSVLQPYYIVSRLPGEAREEFLLIQPFTPAQRHNLVAWIAARNDGESYGELVLYRFPSGRHVDGPNQVGARIDNDPIISEQFTLWGQVGSEVSRGILLVIPVGDAILYAEPVFLRPDTLDFPELRRIILADSRRVVMHPTLERSVSALVGELPAIAAPTDVLEEEPAAGAPPPREPPSPRAEPGVPPDELEELTRSMEDAVEALQEVLEGLRRLSPPAEEGAPPPDG